MKDKTLLKIASIISIVVGILYSLTIIGLIVGIPIIIGGNRLKEISQKPGYDTASDRQTILIWSIVFLFINQLGAIFSIIYYFVENDIKLFDSEDKYDKLEKLKKLYDNKVVTKEEYESEKEKLMNR